VFIYVVWGGIFFFQGFYYSILKWNKASPLFTIGFLLMQKIWQLKGA
jgi:c-di-GMP-related signal transduction protein